MGRIAQSLSLLLDCGTRGQGCLRRRGSQWCLRDKQGLFIRRNDDSAVRRPLVIVLVMIVVAMTVVVVIVMLTVPASIIGVLTHPVVVCPVTMAVVILVAMPTNCNSDRRRRNYHRGWDDATGEADPEARKECRRDESFHTRSLKGFETDGGYRASLNVPSDAIVD